MCALCWIKKLAGYFRVRQPHFVHVHAYVCKLYTQAPEHTHANMFPNSLKGILNANLAFTKERCTSCMSKHSLFTQKNVQLNFLFPKPYHSRKGMGNTRYINCSTIFRRRYRSKLCTWRKCTSIIRDM